MNASDHRKYAENLLDGARKSAALISGASVEDQQKVMAGNGSLALLAIAHILLAMSKDDND